jgi:hypothetical protein
MALRKKVKGPQIDFSKVSIEFVDNYLEKFYEE